MTQFSRQELQDAETSAFHKWSSPSKHFTSGFDPRSSDNALLALMSGGLSHAQQNDWLNAGRRLIDKTYVQILFVTQGLANIPFINAEITATALDNFIRDHIAPKWSLITDTQADKNETALQLVNMASNTLFESLESEIAASHLLFFLCPTLPIVPISHEGEYSSYSQSSLQDMNSHQTYLNGLEIPKAEFGNPDEINLVNSILNETNWWQRNIFKTALFEQFQCKVGASPIPHDH